MKHTGSLVVIAGAGLFAASALVLSNRGTSGVTGLASPTTTCVSGPSTAPLSEGAPMSKTRVLASLAAAAGLAITACGSDDPSPSASSPSTVISAPASAVASSAPAGLEGETVSVKAATSSLGQILVDPEGRTLYAFTNDTQAQSTCTGACANAWPPVIVEGEPTVEGLDQALFTTVDRPDGTKQLKMGKWPLYAFSGDAGPGDVNGQGSGGSWFVVAPDGKLVK